MMKYFMTNIVFVFLCVIILLVNGCKKDSINDKPKEFSEEIIQMVQERDEQQKINNEKIVELLKNLELDRNNSDQILPEEYIYFFGRTKEDIINKLGSNYTIRDHEEIPIEYGWGYTQGEKIIFPGVSFEIRLNENTSKINYFIIDKNNIKYLENIFVGCLIEDVINQLGKPTAIDIVTKQFIYFSQNIRMAFSITHEGKINSIMVSDYTESYNLQLDMK